MNTRENDKWAWWCHRELMASLEAKGKVQKPDSKAKRMKVRNQVTTNCRMLQWVHYPHVWDGNRQQC
jgi:hypothetical protein